MPDVLVNPIKKPKLTLSKIKDLCKEGRFVEWSGIRGERFCIGPCQRAKTQPHG